jgi:DNA-binding HxlR family transcriptional regulator
MLGRTYDTQNCSAARALEVVGERWSLLIIRDALFARHTRFGDFQRSLGVAPNILAARLDSFVDAGLMERRRYSEHPDHYEYLLTDKGRDLAPVIVALSAWGDQYAAPNGPPIIYDHAACGSEIRQQIRCDACDEQVPNADITVRLGPGMPPPPKPDDPPTGHQRPTRSHRLGVTAATTSTPEGRRRR